MIYRPETERLSHYLKARLADQFDAVVHLDETRAVEPLERTAEDTGQEYHQLASLAAAPVLLHGEGQGSRQSLGQPRES